MNNPLPAADLPAIRLMDVHLTLKSAAGPVDILNGVSLSVAQGESIALTGPSGSGKSSLLMLMGGLERATGGEVRALDRDLTAMDEDALARFRRDNMGVVFQSFHLIPTMTALENVAIPLELAGAADAFDRARAELEAVGLGHRIDHYPGQLSGGEQQRTAVARALALDPVVLLADEPSGNLDHANSERLHDLFVELSRDLEIAMVIATHNRSLAQRADRTLLLEDGRLTDIDVREVVP